MESAKVSLVKGERQRQCVERKTYGKDNRSNDKRA